MNKKVILLMLVLPILMGSDYNVEFRPRAAGGGGSTVSYWMGATPNAIPTTAVTRWIPPMGIEPGGIEASLVTSAEGCAVTDGTVDNLKIILGADIGTAGDNLTATVVENGSDTGLTCTISGGAGSETTCTPSGSPVTVAAGDCYAIKLVTAGSPDANVSIKLASIKFTSTTANESALLGHSDTNIGATKYYGFLSSAGAQDSNTMSQIAGAAGNITGLTIKLVTAPGSGKQYVFTILRGGTASDFSCTIADAATTCTDTTGTAFALALGDNYVLEGAPTGAPAASEVSFGARFVATNTNEWMAGASNLLNTWSSGTQYSEPLLNSTTGFNPSETGLGMAMPANLTIKRLYCNVVNTVGAGTLTATIREDAADSTLACALTGTTPSNDSGDVTMEADHVFTWGIAATSTPNTFVGMNLGFGIVTP